MDLVPICEPALDPVSGRSRPPRSALGPIESRLAQAMNASEQMYFFGAPLAHVVDYEDRLRASRCEKTVREVARNCRALQFQAHAVLSPHAARQSEGANDA